MVALPRTAPPSARHCLGTTEPGGWSGDFLVADWDRRPERRLERRRPRRRLGPASFRAPGMATWSGDTAGKRRDPAGHPQGVPLRSSGIGSFKGVGVFLPPLPQGDRKVPPPGAQAERRGQSRSRSSAECVPPTGGRRASPRRRHRRPGGVNIEAIIGAATVADLIADPCMRRPDERFPVAGGRWASVHDGRGGVTGCGAVRRDRGRGRRCDRRGAARGGRHADRRARRAAGDSNGR